MALPPPHWGTDPHCIPLQKTDLGRGGGGGGVLPDDKSHGIGIQRELFQKNHEIQTIRG